MRSPLRIVMTLLGVFFALQGLVWIAKPGRAAEGLGMPLLDGLGRSTQIGDFASFFLASDAWLHVVRSDGRAALERVYQDTLAGRTDPADGHIVSL